MARISKVKFKTGGEITLLKKNNDGIRRVYFDYGEVIIRLYNENITNADAVFMCEAAKLRILHGEN